MTLSDLSIADLRIMIGCGLSVQVIEAIHEELVKREHPEDAWCETCGNPVENGSCLCWCLLADAFQRYAGYDHDSSADAAKRVWDDLEIDVKREVWRADYADDHDVETYPRPMPKLAATMASDLGYTFPDVLRDAIERAEREPYCNHDAAAIHHGVCECGERRSQ